MSSNSSAPSHGEQSDRRRRRPAREPLLRAKELIGSRFAEPLDIATLAAAARLSRAHFIREFGREFGQTPHQYLLACRMTHAALLLRTTDRPVADICRSVGLRSIGSFTTRFGRTFGLPPSAYRAARLASEADRVAARAGQPASRASRRAHGNRADRT